MFGFNIAALMAIDLSTDDALQGHKFRRTVSRVHYAFDTDGEQKEEHILSEHGKHGARSGDRPVSGSTDPRERGDETYGGVDRRLLGYLDEEDGATGDGYQWLCEHALPF
jgi:hypothetical protein